jgi:hypothetical protein
MLALMKKRKPYGRPAKEKIAAPIPRPFDFGFTARRPLIPLRAVSLFLDQGTKQVLTLIEAGTLRWAFDIRTARAGRREVRVLRQSLFEFTGLYVAKEIPPGGERNEFVEIMEASLPRGNIFSPAKMPVSGKGRAAENSVNLLLKMRLQKIALPRLALPKEPVLRATEIAQCFSCNNQHVLNLIHENSLKPVNLRLGPKASPLVTRVSVIEFLKTRRIS